VLQPGAPKFWPPEARAGFGWKATLLAALIAASCTPLRVCICVCLCARARAHPISSSCHFHPHYTIHPTPQISIVSPQDHRNHSKSPTSYTHCEASNHKNHSIHKNHSKSPTSHSHCEASNQKNTASPPHPTHSAALHP
jgi:hypothetical protein